MSELIVFAVLVYLLVTQHKIGKRLSRLEQNTAAPTPLADTPKTASLSSSIASSSTATAAPISISPTPLSSVPLSTRATDVPDKEPKKSFNFEQQFGARLPVWIGGIALALSGFYLVKYTIEKGLMTPEVRTLCGFGFGFALLACAHFIRRRPQFANGARISQSLTGAGIAVLYACFFAASSLYGLLPPAGGFIGMAAVTTAAIVLALRHGLPIALLGMVGGFAAPGMIDSPNPSAATLFIYLYCVTTGLFAVMRYRGWWVLALPTLLAAFGWVLAWTFGHNFRAEDSIWLGLFIIAVAMTFAKTSAVDNGGKEPSKLSLITSHIAFGGAAVLMAALTAKGGFTPLDWGFMALMGLACHIMAYFRPREYRLAPLLSMLVTLFMVANYKIDMQGNGDTAALLAGGFGLLFGAGGLVLAERPTFAKDFAKGSVLATAGFFTIAFTSSVALAGSHAWNAIAMTIAATYAFIAFRTYRKQAGQHTADTSQDILSVYTLATTGFLSAGLMLHRPYEHMSIIFAAEILAAGWVFYKTALPALLRTTKILWISFIFSLLPQVQLLILIALRSLFGSTLPVGSAASVPLLQNPTMQLGLPMLFIGLGVWFMIRRAGAHTTARLVKTLEVTTIALGALLVHYTFRNLLHPGEDVLALKPGFVERGAVTQFMLLGGLGLVYAGRRYVRSAIAATGSVLFLSGIFRIFWIDLLLNNPMSGTQNVGDALLFNGLIVTFGLPLAWMALEEKPAFNLSWRMPQNLKGVIMLTLLICFAGFSVRQMFHGGNLAAGDTGNAEIYTYSFIGLLTGIGLLISGTLRNSKPLRTASLIVMLLTMGKVFLYDTSALEGLYRVASFLGLGLSLIALSWFYSRFVFKGENAEEAQK